MDEKYTIVLQVVNLRLDHMYGVKDDDNKFVAWVLSQLKDQKKHLNE